MTDSKRVYTVEHFELMDGTKIEAKPLSIKRLRAAQKMIQGVFKEAQEIAEADEPLPEDAETTDDKLTDACISIVAMVMRNQEDCDKFLEPDNGRELLEDTLDQETMYEIVRVATGYDFLAMQKQATELAAMGATG